MNVPFKKGIKLITGKVGRSHSEASYAFRRFFEEDFKSPHFPAKYRDPKIREKAIDVLIAVYERDGFTAEEVEILKAKYQSQRGRKPRKKVKKVFDANGIPKVTKTALDPQISALLGYLKRQKVTK